MNKHVIGGLLTVIMLAAGIVLFGGLIFATDRALQRRAVLKSSTPKADCYVKQTPIGIEIQNSLSCVPK